MGRERQARNVRFWDGVNGGGNKIGAYGCIEKRRERKSLATRHSKSNENRSASPPLAITLSKLFPQ